MIVLGPIRRLWPGRRLLLCAWVDDDSPLKSQCPRQTAQGVVIGKGYRAQDDSYPRLHVRGWLRGATCVVGVGGWAGEEPA